jgi:Fe-S cluster biogenesis protein NfuA
MADSGGFREQVKRLSQLVTEFEQTPDTPQKHAVRELLQLLMDVNAQGLERLMEIVFASGEAGQAIIDRLGRDDVAGGLLLLYSLHPESLDARVEAALEKIGPRLRKLSCNVELLSVNDGAVRLMLTKSGHSCGSSAAELRILIENGIYELAPDLAALEVLGLEEPPAAGFVAIESLLGRKMPAAEETGHALQGQIRD